MAVERSVFTTRTWVCPACEATKRVLSWDYDPPPTCCDKPMAVEGGPGAAPAVIGDEIDWTIRHGPVSADGTPVRYRSRGEWKRACIDSGWTPLGETPKTKDERHRWH
jgi:hypothetical protein